MRRLLMLAVPLGLFAATLAAEGDAPPAATPPAEALPAALAEVSAEKAGALRGQPMVVTIRLEDGTDREGVLQDYQSDTGVLVVREKGKPQPTQIKDRGVAVIEFRQPAGIERPTADFLGEVLRERREAVLEEVRKAKEAGKLNEYMKEQTEKLKTAPDWAAGHDAIGRLMTAGFVNNMKREAIAEWLDGISRSVQNEAVHKEVRWTIARLNGKKLDRPGPPGTGPGRRRGPGEGGAKVPEPDRP